MMAKKKKKVNFTNEATIFGLTHMRIFRNQEKYFFANTVYNN